MNAAGGQSVSGNDRAETYLRLQAEAELRTALGYPRYQRPRRRRGLTMFANAHIGFSRAYRRRAATRAFERARSARAQPMLTAGRDLLQHSVSRMWQPVAPGWHRAAIGLWHFRAHVRARLDRSRWEQAPPPAEACLDRMTSLATGFVSAGAVDEDVADSLVEDMRTSLAARGLIDQDDLLSGTRFGHRLSRPMTTPRTGSVRAIPVGAATECDAGDRSGRVYFGTMVLDANGAELTVLARFSPAPTDDAGAMTRRHGRHPLMMTFDACSATDDRGDSYLTHFSGGGSDDDWDGTLHLSPVPPATARWLDVTVPGAEPVRVDLTAPAVSYSVTSTPLAADELAERYVEGVCVDLLRSGRFDGMADDETENQVAAVAGLLISGVLTDRSPALRRFAAAARRVRLDLPAALASVRPEELPAQWLAMQHPPDRDDAPNGFIVLAAMLPELEGAQCVVTGLRSEPEGTTLHVHARGWPTAPHFRSVSLEPFTWTARDDAGGWYATEHAGGGFSSDGRADIDLWLQPSISPAAGSLEIILTGKTGQVSVTVPLDWQEGI
jgi:hypothetical protein